MEQEVGRVGDLQATAGQVGLARRPASGVARAGMRLDLAGGALGALLLADALGDRVLDAVDRR